MRSCWEMFASDQILDEAGFFDNGLPVAEIERGDEMSARLACTPWGFVARSARTSRGAHRIVLAATGAFAPVHDGHIAMMQAARQAAENAGKHVLGGYLAPDHDRYVSTKHPDALTAAQRVARCEDAVKDLGWLCVDPWPALWVGEALNYTDVIERLQRYLRAHVADDIDVWFVGGSDNAGFARVFSQFGGCVIVQRDAPVSASDRVEHPNVIYAGPTAASSQSSTKVRRRSSTITDLTAGPSEPSQYVLRDDLNWAIQPWAARHPQIHRAASRFSDDVTAALRAALADSAAAIRFVDPGEQKQLTDQLIAAGANVLNLDPVTSATERLSLCRMFDCSDAQISARKLCGRPGAPPLDEQLRRIPAGEYDLVDDDIATGFTVEHVRALLPDDVAVRRTHSLLAKSAGDAPIFDVVDLRDFLLGARQAGLVVELPDATPARVPYMAPFVQLRTRAKIPAEACQSLSRSLWEANLRFFARVPVKVADAAPATRRFIDHFHPDAVALADVCREVIEHFDEPPYLSTVSAGAAG